MKILKHLNKFVRIVLVAVLTLILIHDIHPLDINTHGKTDADTASTKHDESDHSDGCDDACPCVIHVLEKSSQYGKSESTIFYLCTLIYINPELKHESIVPKTLDRPPKA